MESNEEDVKEDPFIPYVIPSDFSSVQALEGLITTIYSAREVCSTDTILTCSVKWYGNYISKQNMNGFLCLCR